MVESVSLGEFDDRVLPIMDSGIPTCCIPTVSFPSKSIVLWKLFVPVENMMVSRLLASRARQRRDDSLKPRLSIVAPLVDSVVTSCEVSSSGT
jgi:hypothetical protein